MSRLSPISWRKTPPAKSRGLWDPFTSLHDEIDRLFDSFGQQSNLPGRMAGSSFVAPNIDISETDDAWKVEADLPGLEPENIDLMLADGVLTIKGEKKVENEEKKKDYHIVERSSGSFQRSIQVPFDVDPDKIQADFSNGVLTVSIPKPTEAAGRSRRIAIETRKS